MPETTSGARRVSPEDKATTPMRYALQLPNGDYFDAEIPTTALDPYFTECPDGCNSAETGHTMEGSDEDRGHSGDLVSVPLRDLPTIYTKSTADDRPGQPPGQRCPVHSGRRGSVRLPECSCYVLAP